MLATGNKHNPSDNNNNHLIGHVFQFHTTIGSCTKKKKKCRKNISSKEICEGIKRSDKH